MLKYLDELTSYLEPPKSLFYHCNPKGETGTGLMTLPNGNQRKGLDDEGGSLSMPLCKAVRNLNGHTVLCLLTGLANQEAEEMVYSREGLSSDKKYTERWGENATSLLNQPTAWLVCST